MLTKNSVGWVAWLAVIVVAISACSASDVSPDEATGSAEDELRWLRFCGGLRDVQCPDEQFCNARVGHCPDERRFGRCVQQPSACTKEYEPVCGCDGLSYGNACEAAASGVSIASFGACEITGEFCGGIAGFPCPTGQTCIDDPRDDCDPESGGADCGGICVP
jgi:hypothetical protein